MQDFTFKVSKKKSRDILEKKLDPCSSTFIFSLTVQFIFGAESMHADTRYYTIKASKSFCPLISYINENRKKISFSQKFRVLATAI